jgi:CBS domain-containing protein
MRIGELATRRVVTATADETVAAAANRMADEHVGCLVVVQRGAGVDRPVGVLTDRDIVVKVVAERRYADATRVVEVMSRAPVVANEMDDPACALELARTHGVRRLPVVASDGGLVGILTIDDLIEWLGEQAASVVKTMRQGERRERAERPI